MFNQIEIIILIITSFGFGIALTLTTYHMFQKSSEEFREAENQIIDLEKRITPFINIHNSIVEEESIQMDNTTVNRLRDKIESFKNRNRFYHS